MPKVSELPVPENLELEPNLECISRSKLRFLFEKRRSGFDSEPTVFQQFFAVRFDTKLIVFYGSGSISQFSGGFGLEPPGTGSSSTVSISKF